MGIRSREDKTLQVVSHLVLAFFSVLAIIPFWLLITSSLTDVTVATRDGYQFFPAKFSLEAFDYILKEWGQIGRAYGITLLVTVLGTLGSVVLVSMLAYGLSKKNIPGLRIVFVLILITMLFNGGIVPTYYLYNNILHVKNTIWALLVPNLLMSGFTVILVKSFMEQNIPKELMEAAEIDGAGQLTVFRKLVLPLARPILATVGLLQAVAYWNDWTNGLYFVTKPNLYSIQLLLNKMNDEINFLANNSTIMVQVDITAIPSATVRMAIAVVAILPIMIIYPFFHKFFAKGITLGAVKG